MSEWKNIPENVSDWFGFVYRITNTANGKKYIGKKQFFKNEKRPPLKGKKRSRRVHKESDWKSYYGSSNELKSDLQKYGKDVFEREILEYTTCKWESAWKELEWQIKEKVLFRDDYYNGIINIRLNGPPKTLFEKYQNENTELIKGISTLKVKNIDGEIIKFDPIQIKILNNWNNNKKNILLKHRQLGATTMMIAFSIYQAFLNPSPKNILILANKEQQCDHIRQLIKDILKYSNIDSYIYDLTDDSIILKDSKITVILYKDYDKLRGYKFDYILADEVFFCDYIEDLNKILSIYEDHSNIILYGTPKYEHDIHYFEKNNWNIDRIDIYNTRKQFNEEYINNMKKICSDEDFLKEFELFKKD